MKIALILISLLAFQNLKAQDTLIIFFKDKGNTELIQLSERAIERRKKNKVQIDSRDKKVNQTYIELMKSEGTVMNVSRWLNGLTLITNQTTDELITKYDFIKDITINKSVRPVKGLDKLKVSDEEKATNYGAAQDQILQIDLDCLHDQGYNGNGVFVAVIDAGFKGMDTVGYFDSAYIENRVIDTYDIIGGTPDVYQYSNHGTMVSSCIVAEKLGVVDGFSATAVEVDIALYVSENAGSETIIEEFDLVVALERSDSVGVDVANISLGYTNFDNPADDHPFSDMDGETTIAAIGTNVASSKGILVVTSAGNSGPSPISTPCDADSCLCIGAIDFNGWYVDFSSLGPSADGQVKPDVMARGKDAAVVHPNGNQVYANGTSFSSPIMAGAMACLIQANPTKTVEELKLAIRQSGNVYTNPNSFTGYGVPSMCVAHDSLNSVAKLQEFDMNEVSIYPNPSSGFISVEINDGSQEQITFELFNVLGEVIEIKEQHFVNGQFVLDLRSVSSGLYILKISNGKHLVASKRIIKN